MAADYFLKLDGIEGESTDDKHKGEIDLNMWSFSEYQHATGGGGGGSGGGKVSMADMHFGANQSKASCKLFLACATGEHIKTATLTCRKAGGTQNEYLKIVLTQVLVSSYSNSGQSEGGVPADAFSLNFSKIEIEYKEQKADGSAGPPCKAGYDRGASKKV